MSWIIIAKIFLAGVFILVNIFLFFNINRFYPSTTPPPSTILSRAPSATVNKSNADVQLPILVFGCNRPRALQNHIEGLLRIRKSSKLNPIIISLDCHHHATVGVARNFGDKIETIIEVPNFVSISGTFKDTGFYGYHRISRHYGYSLNQVLNVLNYEAVIVTEDDLEVSPDFLDYFHTLYPLLFLDKSIWCISAWNDNGLDGKIDRQPTLLHRSDFFPGLGWLLTKTLWNEMKPKWPLAFWDDWMRQPEQRRDRVCIRPEVSRTGMSTEGKRGVSGSQYYEEYLKKIIKNTDTVDWKSINVTYLIKDLYDPVFHARIDACPIITVSALGDLNSDMKCAQLHYKNNNEFIAIANNLGLMSDIRSNTPRTAYLGVVQIQHGKTRIYITLKQ